MSAGTIARTPIGWRPDQTATHWMSRRGPLPHLPTEKDARQCGLCGEQGKYWEIEDGRWVWDWCEACGGTGRV